MRVRLFTVSAIAMGIITLGACGDGGTASIESLPLLVAVTTTTIAEAIVVQPATGDQTYTVQKGDTLSVIAQSFGVTMDQLSTINGITNPDAIQAGQKLKIPAGGTVPLATTTTVVATTISP